MAHHDSDPADSLACPECGAMRTNEYADCAACGWQRVPAPAAAEDAAAEEQEMHCHHHDVPATPEEQQEAEREAARNAACHCCGCPEFEWGAVSDAAYHPPPAESLLEWLFPAYRTLEARRCLHCGNVQLFVT